MKKILLLFLITSVFSACEKEITDSITIGNIYCSDGTTIHPSNYPESGKKAVGIIFWVNEKSDDPKGLAVTLEDLSPALWADTLVAISNVSTDMYMFNGLSNTVSIVSWGIDEGRQTTAITNAYLYSLGGVVGWFVPSYGEAKYLFGQKNKIESSLKICGGTAFLADWYWTSTQDGSGDDNAKMNAVAISFNEGNGTVTQKFNNFPVRPIIAIK